MDKNQVYYERFEELLRVGGLEEPQYPRARIIGSDPVLDTPYRIGEAAATVIAAQCEAVSRIWDMRCKGFQKQNIDVDVTAAALSTKRVKFLRQNGYEVPLPDLVYPTVQMYPTRDGRFILLNGGYPRLRNGILSVLECANREGAIGAAVASWDAEKLEEKLQKNGLCGVMVRNSDEWLDSEQGSAILSHCTRDGFFHALTIEKICDAAPQPFPENGISSRPLSNIRVLDLTHVLAGPTCASVLAQQDATVLHIAGPAQAVILPFVMDTGHGKFSAQLDLKDDKGKERLWELIDEGADVFSESYRPGAIASFGFSPEKVAERLRKKGRGIICVTTNCYDYNGPWQYFPGWEQLAQSATGLAVGQGSIDCPNLLPTYPNDYLTGYLSAYGVLAALIRRAEEGGSFHVKVSLCRTAMWLQQFGMLDTQTFPPKELDEEKVKKYLMTRKTGFGELEYFGPVPRYSVTTARWKYPTVPLGYHKAVWPLAEEEEEESFVRGTNQAECN